MKFNSAWRRDSHRERPSHEQAAYCRRIARECRFFTLVALLQVMRAELWGPTPVFPEFAQPPERNAPGWTVEQWRRYRGL